MKIRINKLVAERCEISRRKADEYIHDGRVTVNGTKAILGTMADEDDDIRVDDHRTVQERHQRAVIALHKPVGYMTTMDRSKQDTVMDLIVWNDGRLFPVGRLDVDSSGLLLLTNDGQLANKLMHPRYAHEKEYDVDVDRPISDSDLVELRRGVKIEGRKTAPAEVLRLSEARFRIMIKEGRNRQIRRMCEAIGYRVKRLQRIRVSSVKLGSLKVGQWRLLTAVEVKKLEV